MSTVSKLTEQIQKLEEGADNEVMEVQRYYKWDATSIMLRALTTQLRAVRLQLELNRSEIGNIPDELRHLRR